MFEVCPLFVACKCKQLPGTGHAGLGGWGRDLSKIVGGEGGVGVELVEVVRGGDRVGVGVGW